MSLLKINNLTMRFGGLTAVSGLDIDVPAGAIYSVIGPNGAGKTTVFNAITGIYTPTAGTIEFDGRRLRRPFGWKVVCFCACVGVLSSIAALLISVDVNALWKATIKRNLQDRSRPFSGADVWNAFTGYLHGNLSVERKGVNWAVVPWNSSLPVLGTAKLRSDARELAEMLDDVVAGDRSLSSIPHDSSHWKLTADSHDILAIAGARRTQARIEWLALFGGLIVATAGTYVVWNRARQTPDVIAAGGIARTFQNIRLFTSMTVLENVQVAMDRATGSAVRRFLVLAGVLLVAGGILVWIVLPAVWPAIPAGLETTLEILLAGGLIVLIGLAQWRKQRDERESCRRAFDGLSFVGLQSKCAALAGSLAYGDQRRLEIARALALKPRLLLLDEPAAGMNPTESADLTKLIRRIRDSGVTVLLIEHHMKVVMGISDRLAVLDHGVKIAEGTPAEVRCNPKVIEAYLGKEECE